MNKSSLGQRDRVFSVHLSAPSSSLRYLLLSKLPSGSSNRWVIWGPGVPQGNDCFHIRDVTDPLGLHIMWFLFQFPEANLSSDGCASLAFYLCTTHQRQVSNYFLPPQLLVTSVIFLPGLRIFTLEITSDSFLSSFRWECIGTYISHFEVQSLSY